MKDEHVNDAAQGVLEDVPQDVAQELAFGARAARALLATPPPPRRPVFVQFALRWGRNWAAQWHLARAVGKRSWGAAQSASMLVSGDRQIDSQRGKGAIGNGPLCMRMCPLSILRSHTPGRRTPTPG